MPLNNDVNSYEVAPLKLIGVAAKALPAVLPIAILWYTPLPPLNVLTLIVPVPLIPLPVQYGVRVKFTGANVVVVVVGGNGPYEHRQDGNGKQSPTGVIVAADDADTVPCIAAKSIERFLL